MIEDEVVSAEVDDWWAAAAAVASIVACDDERSGEFVTEAALEVAATKEGGPVFTFRSSWSGWGVGEEDAAWRWYSKAPIPRIEAFIWQEMSGEM